MNQKDNKDSSGKITRTFRVHSNIFNQFKAEVSLRYSNYSAVLECLMLFYLKEPEKYNPYKRT